MGFNRKQIEARTYAKRYLESNFDYGRGSRINRRNVHKTVEIKRKDPEWNAYFLDAVAELDPDKIYKDLQIRKKLESEYRRGKKGLRILRKVRRLFYDLRGLIE